MITSLSNKKVKEWAKLHQKKYRKDAYLVKGAGLHAAYQAGMLKEVLYVDRNPYADIIGEQVSREVMDKLDERSNLIGLASKAIERPFCGNRVMLLDGLQDPLNMGMIFYTAESFGFDSIVIENGSADLYNEKAIETARGSQYRVPFCHSDLFSTVQSLKEQGYVVYATGLQNDTKALSEVKANEKMAFILGNEGSGVRKELMAECDGTVKIEMENIDSLNVAVAGAIMMYTFSTIRK